MASMSGISHSMGPIFTVHSGTASGARRQATLAATHARRSRLHMHDGRPSDAAATHRSRQAAR